MAAENPYDDPVLGDAWIQGFLAGHNEPETDHLRPFSPELLEAYQQGEMAGRDVRRQLPGDQGGEETDEHDELAEVALELGLHTLGHVQLHKVFHAVGGLIGLVAMVVVIPGDVMLKPMDDDWTGPPELPEDDGAFFAACPRNDHGPMQGATSDGYWTSPSYQTYSDAQSEAQRHGHAECAVVRCSISNGECGFVWPG